MQVVNIVLIKNRKIALELSFWSSFSRQTLLGPENIFGLIPEFRIIYEFRATTSGYAKRNCQWGFLQSYFMNRTFPLLLCVAFPSSWRQELLTVNRILVYVWLTTIDQVKCIRNCNEFKIKWHLLDYLHSNVFR